MASAGQSTEQSRQAQEVDAIPTLAWSARALYYDGAYGPFGEPYAQSGTTDVSFTGQDQDTVSNLYDFPAREYGIQGRWPSPDPAGISSVRINDPQTWNRYSYVRNNPLKLTDPTGMTDCDMWFGCTNGTGGGWGGGGGGFSVTTSNGSSGGANPSGVCVYLNDAGTGVDQQYGNGIDMGSNAGECGMNGGYFFPGYGNPATISIDSNGGLDPNTESAVTMSGNWNGSFYNLTMSVPQAQAPNQSEIMIAAQKVCGAIGKVGDYVGISGVAASVTGTGSIAGTAATTGITELGLGGASVGALELTPIGWGLTAAGLVLIGADLACSL